MLKLNKKALLSEHPSYIVSVAGNLVYACGSILHALKEIISQIDLYFLDSLVFVWFFKTKLLSISLISYFFLSGKNRAKTI